MKIEGNDQCHYIISSQLFFNQKFCEEPFMEKFGGGGINCAPFQSPIFNIQAVCLFGLPLVTTRTPKHCDTKLLSFSLISFSCNEHSQHSLDLKALNDDSS